MARQPRAIAARSSSPSSTMIGPPCSAGSPWPSRSFPVWPWPPTSPPTPPTRSWSGPRSRAIPSPRPSRWPRRERSWRPRPRASPSPRAGPTPWRTRPVPRRSRRKATPRRPSGRRRRSASRTRPSCSRAMPTTRCGWPARSSIGSTTSACCPRCPWPGTGERPSRRRSPSTPTTWGDGWGSPSSSWARRPSPVEVWRRPRQRGTSCWLFPASVESSRDTWCWPAWPRTSPPGPR